MERDIKAVILLLATQCTINLGTIPDPVTRETYQSLEKALVFLDLLKVLENKTSGNLTEEESLFLKDIITNLSEVYNKIKD